MTSSEKSINQPESMPEPEITRDIQVADLISHFPFSIAFLTKKNLPCIICGEPVWGTLGELAGDMHFTPEQTELLVEELKTEAKRNQG